MKKIYFFMMLLSASFMNVQANCYFTIDGAVNDTLHLSPSLLGNAVNLTIGAHFDGRLDYWHLTMTYPSGLSFNEANAGSGMSIPFINRMGEDSVYKADLVILQSGNIIMSSISKYGYYPVGGGNYDTYGTIKWEAGDYPCMFTLMLDIDNSFHYGTLGINGVLSSTFDWRGGTIQTGGESFYKAFVIHVGYRRGDVNGDGFLNINDVTLLNNYLLGQITLDVYKLEAADVNGDGLVNVADMTALVNILLQNGGINAHDLEEVL